MPVDTHDYLAGRPVQRKVKSGRLGVAWVVYNGYARMCKGESHRIVCRAAIDYEYLDNLLV